MTFLVVDFFMDIKAFVQETTYRKQLETQMLLFTLLHHSLKLDIDGLNIGQFLRNWLISQLSVAMPVEEFCQGSARKLLFDHVASMQHCHSSGQRDC